MNNSRPSIGDFVRRLNQWIFEHYMQACGAIGFLTVSGGLLLILFLWAPHWLGFRFPHVFLQMGYGTLCFFFLSVWLGYNFFNWWRAETEADTGTRPSFAVFLKEIKTGLWWFGKRAAIAIMCGALGGVGIWGVQVLWTRTTATPALRPIPIKLTLGQPQRFPLSIGRNAFVVKLPGKSALWLKTEAGVSLQIINEDRQSLPLKKTSPNEFILAVTEAGEYCIVATTATMRQSGLEAKLVKPK